MSIFNADIYTEEQNVLEVRANTNLSCIEKKELIMGIRKGSGLKAGNSTLKTVLNLTNINFGFTLLVFGIQFKQTGFVFGIIAVVIAFIVNVKTALIQIAHCKNQDMDFPEIVGRVMGVRSKKLYIISSVFYVNLNVLINFVYSADMLYSVISYICDLNGIKLPGKEEFSLSTFSFQYAGVIMFVLYNLAFLIKDIKSLALLGPVGVLSVFIVVIFSTVQGILNFENISLIFHFDLKATDFAILLAALSMGFFGHYFHLPILKNNLHQSNNRRDLVASYILTSSLFLVDALFGSIALADKKISNEPSILDFFAKSWYIMAIRILILIQLFTSVVFSTYIMKAKMWSLLQEDRFVENWMNLTANFSFTLFWLLLQFFNVNMSTLITLAGGFGAFLGIYFFPILVHLKCLYSRNEHNDLEDTKIDNSQFLDDDNKSFSQNQKINSDCFIERHRGGSLFESLSSSRNSERCRSDHKEYMKVPKATRFGIYSLFFSVGLFVLIVRIYAMFL